MRLAIIILIIITEEEKTDTTTTEPVATVTVDEVQTEADVIQIVDDAVPSTTPEMVSTGILREKTMIELAPGQ